MDIKWFKTIQEYDAAQKQVHARLKKDEPGYKEGTEIYQDQPVINKDTSQFGLEIDTRVKSKAVDLVSGYIINQETKIYKGERDDLEQQKIKK
jgi:hypothetical protein